MLSASRGLRARAALLMLRQDAVNLNPLLFACALHSNHAPIEAGCSSSSSFGKIPTLYTNNTRRAYSRNFIERNANVNAFLSDSSFSSLSSPSQRPVCQFRAQSSLFPHKFHFFFTYFITLLLCKFRETGLNAKRAPIILILSLK